MRIEKYPPTHEKPSDDLSFDRLDMLWKRYPQYHERTTFSTMEELLEEHESWENVMIREDGTRILDCEIYGKRIG